MKYFLSPVAVSFRQVTLAENSLPSHKWIWISRENRLVQTSHSAPDEVSSSPLQTDILLFLCWFSPVSPAYSVVRQDELPVQFPQPFHPPYQNQNTFRSGGYKHSVLTRLPDSQIIWLAALVPVPYQCCTVRLSAISYVPENVVPPLSALMFLW